jgi:hypothetical protein
VQCETDGLGGGCVQTQLGAMHSDPRPDKIHKVRELGAYQVPRKRGALLLWWMSPLIVRECKARLELISRSVCDEHRVYHFR